nr:hypothetical protein [Tanacetum cinerariifolium]
MSEIHSLVLAVGKHCKDLKVQSVDHFTREKVLLFYTASLRDNLRSFVTEVLPPYANELLMLPPLEYNNKDLDSLNKVTEMCVFKSKMLKFLLVIMKKIRKFDEFHIVVAQPQSLKMKKIWFIENHRKILEDISRMKKG